MSLQPSLLRQAGRAVGRPVAAHRWRARGPLLLLGAAGIEVNQAKTDSGFTALMYAAQQGHERVVELLLHRQSV